MSLSLKQGAFVNEYLTDFNATRAAQRAGYTGNENTLAVTGHDLLRNPKIAEAISQRLSETAMGADEVIRRLADHARGNLKPFLVQTPDNENITVNLTTPQAQANIHLIKKITQRRVIRTKGDDEEIEDTTLSIELYDAQAALNTLAKHHGLLVDKTELTGKDGRAIEHDVKSSIVIYIPDNGRDVASV